MAAIDILPMIEPSAEQRSARAAHEAELLGEIRQILRRRRCLTALRHLELTAAANRPAENITQYLAKDVATGHLARHLRSVRLRRHGASRHGNLYGSAANHNRLDAALANPFLQLAQHVAEQIAFRTTRSARFVRSRRRRAGWWRHRACLRRRWKRRRRRTPRGCSRHSAAEYLAQDVPQ